MGCCAQMDFYEASQLHLLVFASIKLAGGTVLCATSGQQEVLCDGHIEIKLLSKHLIVRIQENLNYRILLSYCANIGKTNT